MRHLWRRFLCLAGRHRWVISLHCGRPAVRLCRWCALAKEE